MSQSRPHRKRARAHSANSPEIAEALHTNIEFRLAMTAIDTISLSLLTLRTSRGIAQMVHHCTCELRLPTVLLRREDLKGTFDTKSLGLH